MGTVSKALFVALVGVAFGLFAAKAISPVAPPPMTSKGGGAITGPQLPACTSASPCNIAVTASVDPATELCQVSVSSNVAHVKPGGVINWSLTGNAEFRNKHGIRIDGNPKQRYYTCNKVGAKALKCTRTPDPEVRAFSYTLTVMVENPNDPTDKDIPCAYDPIIVSRD